jgi:hypothetical protein
VFADHVALIVNWDDDLPFELQTRPTQLRTQGIFVSCFQESRPKSPVHLDRTPNDPVRQFRVCVFLCVSDLSVLCVSVA